MRLSLFVAVLLLAGAAHAQVLLRDLDATDGPAASTITSGHGHAVEDLVARSAGSEPQLRCATRQVCRARALPAGDLAGATALYVVASYEVYRDASVDPAVYQPVIRQLRRTLGALRHDERRGAPHAVRAARDPREMSRKK